jgi:hypothetical protein
MRLLERCIQHWPMHIIKLQVQALREAFSADTGKPFELKPGFPYGSPTPQPSEMPMMPASAYGKPPTQDVPLESTATVSYNNTLPAGRSDLPVTPPMSIVEEENQTDHHLVQSVGLIPGQSPTSQGMVQTPQQQGQWNPQRLFE